jgi:hypothetical protein
LQVCNFVSLNIYKIKKSRKYKLIITIYNLTNCKCGCLQICKYASLQIYKTKKIYRFCRKGKFKPGIDIGFTKKNV